MSPSEEIYTRDISKFHPQQVLPGCDVPQPKRKANHQPLEKKQVPKVCRRAHRRGLRPGGGASLDEACVEATAAAVAAAVMLRV